MTSKHYVILEEDVVDGLTSTSTNTPLSANQGKVLNETKQDLLTFDSSPIALSSNPVTSGGIRTAIDNKVRSGTTPPSGTANIGDIYVQYSA